MPGPTEDQYLRLLARVTKLEETSNDLIVAMGRFITQTEISQLMVLQDTEFATLTEQVNALEARITTIEEEPVL